MWMGSHRLNLARRCGKAAKSVFDASQAPNIAPPFLPQGASNWPVFDDDDIEIVEFGDTIASVPGHRAGRCSQLRSMVTL